MIQPVKLEGMTDLEAKGFKSRDFFFTDEEKMQGTGFCLFGFFQGTLDQHLFHHGSVCLRMHEEFPSGGRGEGYR